MADMEWIVDGDRYTIRLNGHINEDPHMLKLDASRKHVDVFHHWTPGTYGGKLKGIYEINGDSLIVCYDLTGQGYPKSFDVKRGSRQGFTDFGGNDNRVLIFYPLD